MMCSPFKKYGICQYGIQCNHNHNYDGKDINLTVALNVLMGSNHNIMKEMTSINRRLDRIEKDVQELKDKSKDTSIILNKIKNVDSKMEDVMKSARSGGLPLRSYYTTFQESQVAHFDLPISLNTSSTKHLNERAISTQDNPRVGLEVFKSSSSVSEQFGSDSNNSTPEDKLEEKTLFDINLEDDEIDQLDNTLVSNTDPDDTDDVNKAKTFLRSILSPSKLGDTVSKIQTNLSFGKGKSGTSKRPLEKGFFRKSLESLPMYGSTLLKLDTSQEDIEQTKSTNSDPQEAIICDDVEDLIQDIT
ncbi:ORF5 [Erthesina fullo arlivirus 1]|uniref:ORF5 n=1 Tax=Erthesina fullo arlivirus 1 TaxID=2945982 RepID=UPI002481EDB7|nr:ORF5 [Erthesina fullo arlivirus 1]URA30373.1 ORF5 [Erthesina fullo arlivirus 1]